MSPSFCSLELPWSLKIEKEIHPNFAKTDHIEGLIAIKCDALTHRGKTHEPIFFSHPDLQGLVSTAHQYVCVNQEGDSSDFWGTYLSHHLGALP